MALIYTEASITPTKRELLRSWIPAQPWFDGTDPERFETIGAYRFDDPDGEVGIETHLVRTAGGAVLQVPLTYRSAPLDGVAEIATMQHTALGTRWVYDGCLDPVCVAAFVTAIRTGGSEASLETDSGEVRESRTRVTGSGAQPSVEPATAGTPTSDERATVVPVGDDEFVLLRVVDVTALDGDVLTGTWPGHDDPTVLAAVRPSVPDGGRS